jgi:glycosyltransferase involved in cell wall biosynthesis
MIHARFAPRSFVEAVAGLRADILVARRLYMAQAALDAHSKPDRLNLATLADVLESEVLRQRRSADSPLLRFEARRTWRDEVRCARESARVACLSETERALLAPQLPDPPERVDLVLRPAERPALLDEPLALFVGDLHWPPNEEAAHRLVGIWPAIRSACPTARLLMVGRGTDALPTNGGIERLGFVEDIDAVWDRPSLLVAPVSIGGGVRVKLLDAARRGVPVVATAAAVGSVSDYLPIRAAGSDDELVDRAAELLGSRDARREAGQGLYEANRQLSRDGFVERQLEQLLTPRKPQPA